MAEIQDEDFESNVGEIEAVEEQTQKTEPPAYEPPAQYRNKGIEELVKMNEEAQKLINRQSHEVGEIRKLADELIKTQIAPKPREEKPVDFFENPNEAVRQHIQNDPRLAQVEAMAKSVQMEQARARLAQLHPDAVQLSQDGEFQSWVQSSPVRRKLFQQADAYDVDAAHELLSTYKELKAVRQQRTEAVDNSARDQALKAAAVDTGGSGEGTRKVYRRADLIRLKMRDPAKYEAMGDEILQAYAEGRVK